MAKASRAEWAKRVARWQDSGLTAKEFAAELAVSPNSLTFWKWKLRRELMESDAASSNIKPVVKAAEPKFLQLVAAHDDTAGAAVPLEVVIGGDIVVRVPQGFDEQTLTRVLHALGAR